MSDEDRIDHVQNTGNNQNQPVDHATHITPLTSEQSRNLKKNRTDDNQTQHLGSINYSNIQLDSQPLRRQRGPYDPIDMDCCCFKSNKTEDYHIQQDSANHCCFKFNKTFLMSEESIKYYDTSHYTCYQTKQSKGSLFRAILSWLFRNMLALILVIPILVLTSFLSLLNPWAAYHIFGRYIIFICVMTIILVSWFLRILDIYPCHIDKFYSVMSVIIMVLFRHAIIVTWKIRENIVYDFSDSQKQIESKREYCPNLRRCLAPISICSARITDCIVLSICCVHIFDLLRWFAFNYRIFGVSLVHYVPVGMFTISESSWNTSVITKKKKSVYRKMRKCMKKFGTTSHGWSFKKSLKLYDSSDRIMTICSFVCALSYVILPFIIYAIRATQYDVWFIIHIISGLVINAVLVYSVTSYTEIIFYALFQYYSYMQCMAGLLQIDEVPIVKVNRMDDKLHLQPVKEEVKEQADVRKEPLIQIYKQSISDVLQSDDSYYTLPGKSADTIYLDDEDNCQVWFENWCRIENLASIYFENRKSNIFAFVACIISGIGVVVYSWWNGDELLTADNAVVGAGLCYFVVVIARLLLCSVRFSDLQRIQIGLIQNQCIFAMHNGLEQNTESSQNPMRQDKHLKIKYMKEIIEQIEYRSLSPTIAGVSLNNALAQLIITTLIGYATSAITYALKN